MNERNYIASVFHGPGEALAGSSAAAKELVAELGNVDPCPY